MYKKKNYNTKYSVYLEKQETGFQKVKTNLNLACEHIRRRINNV